jgi:membrane associated rhomboid family serine protease
MSANVRIFISIFCYITAACGVVLAVVNASQKPPATATAVMFGISGVIFGIFGLYLTRRPRY